LLLRSTEIKPLF